ncbi:hypothetical protein DYB32_006282 [Aphanomyces invadans]|uniref:Uncharacterized protein n=1 Tax=Aphanomyces invadans TaxID=157072 RepID=A0A418AS47_9STRA|nr:hypothetical protein DYB32_006282 [Aphanomyces invadans]
MRLCRQRRRGTGDANATIVSEALPFLEYEMHRQVCYTTCLTRHRCTQMKHDAMCVIPPEFKTDRIKIESDDKAHKRALRKLKKKEDSSATSVERKPSTGDVDVPATLGDDEKVSSSDSSSDSEDEVSPDVNTFVSYKTKIGMTQHGANIHLFLSMKRVEWDEEHTRDTRVNVLFSHVFKMLFTRYAVHKTLARFSCTPDGLASLLFKLRAFAPCVVCGLRTRVALAADNIIEVVLMGMAMLAGPELPPVDTALPFGSAGGGTSFADDDDAAADPDASPSLRLQILHNASAFSQVAPPMSPSVDAAATAAFVGPNAREWIELTPLSYVPGAKILRYLGRITLHFIKESWTVRECGGLGAFFHLFLSEAISVVRAHVRALGGNAMLSFRLVPIESSQLYRNQVYNMISVTGYGVDACFRQGETFEGPGGRWRLTI